MANLEKFQKQNYLNLETFRKTGEGVKTPVWFVEFKDQLCFTTEPQSGKVKRMRRNPQVRVAPCKMDGTLLGDWSPATIRFLQKEEAQAVDKLYKQKYGPMLFFFDLAKIFNKKPERTFIAISLDSPSEA